MGDYDKIHEIQSGMMSDAWERERKLEARVVELEKQVNHLQEYIRRIEERLGMR